MRTTKGKPTYERILLGDRDLATALGDALAAVEFDDRATHGFHTYPAGLHPDAARDLVREIGFSHAAGFATPALLDRIGLLQESLFDRVPAFGVPTSFLLDGEGRLAAIWLGSRVESIEAGDALTVRFSGKDAPEGAAFDRVLVAVGRRPNGDRIGAEAAGLHVDERGFVPVDASQRRRAAARSVSSARRS